MVAKSEFYKCQKNPMLNGTTPALHNLAEVSFTVWFFF